jgi:glycosyltransferase involved in cell wall biosynthesis
MNSKNKKVGEKATNNSLTIAVLALNEADTIAQCLRSADFADQLIVIDSGSTDTTREIAHSLGAEVYTYSDWQGFGIQRMRALKHCSCDYLFFLDCDELIPKELADEIRKTISKGEVNLGLIRWDDYILGKRLQGIHQTKGVARLFKTSNLLGFEGEVHESAIYRSPTIHVVFKTRLIHYSRRSIYQSLLKLVQYSQLGAIKLKGSDKQTGVRAGLLHAAPKFLNLYLFKGSFRSGAEGFIYSFLISLEIFFKYCAARYDISSEAEKAAKR